MALSNRRTGFYGFTIDGMDGIKSDATGSVKKCIFSIAYQLQPNDVDFVISSGAEDWAAQMGDGSIIPLSNPKVLYQNRDSSIVEFDMAVEYAANSPCILVYGSDTASFHVSNHTGDPRPFSENTLSGHFAFTTEGYNGDSFENGYVNRLLCTISFPYQVADVEFSISAGDDHWAARMGDGSMINLKNPEVVATNNDNAVVKFDMEESYPSNSPCIIVYRNSEATFKVDIITKPQEFVPVLDIKGVPEKITSGVTVDLSSCDIIPSNSTVKAIEWSIISGDAFVNGDSLTITGTTNVVLQGLAPRGTDEETDFIKQFNIEIVENSITILAQPAENVKLVHGSVTGDIYVNAKSGTGVISYKWYQNTINSVSGAVAVHDGNKSNYLFPVSIDPGIYYYYCEISSPGAATVRSNICRVDVNVSLESIKITPRIENMDITDTGKFNIEYYPTKALEPKIVWKSSDSNIIQIDEEGNTLAIHEGTVTITATTVDGLHSDSITITVAPYVSVTDITNLITDVTANTYTEITGTIVPGNSTMDSIKWEVIDTGDTEAFITEDNKLHVASVGVATLRATIEKGISPTQDFIKEFKVTVAKAFVPVTDITLVDFPETLRADQTASVVGKVIPDDANNNNIFWNISNQGSTGAVLENGVLSFTAAGTFTLLATVINGAGPISNFTKEFTISIDPAWVPIDHIDMTPETYDPNAVNGEPIRVSYSVYPENATVKDVIIEMIDASVANATFDSSTMMLQIDPQKMTYDMEAVVVMQLKVVNGYNEGKDYVITKSIMIIPPPAPEEYIPVTNVDLVLPVPARCHYPILLNHSVIYPWNSTVKNLVWSGTRAQEYGGADNFIFNPTEYEFNHIQKSPFFDWGLDEVYLFPYDPGKINLDLIIYKGLGPSPGEDYEESFMIETLSPYIAVKDISNIPIEIPCGKDFIISGELETNGGIGYHNATWDEEVPSYDNLSFRIGSEYFDEVQYPNNAGVVLKGENNNTIYCDHPGEFTIQVYVENGIKEPIAWYGKTQEGEAFTKLYTIRAVASETRSTIPIVTLTLNTGSTVKVHTMTDLNNLCTDLPSDSIITIDNNTFRKDQVTAVSFWEESSSNDRTIPVEDISLAANTIDTYTLIAPEVETYSFDDVVPSDDPDGCVKIEDENSDFNGMYTLPDNTFLHPDGTIVRHYVSDDPDVEDLILNIKYADSVFTINPEYIHFPDEFIKYDNGYISIPEGTILDTNGNLIVPNPEYDEEHAEEVYPILYTISINGVVYDNTTSAVILPMGTSIKDGNIIKLHDNCIYNLESVTEEYITSSEDDEDLITLPYGSYINDSNEICISDDIKFTTDSADRVNVDNNKFLKFEDGTIIFEDGKFFTSDEKLFDIYGREINASCYLNISNNAMITPESATNKEIHWNIIESPEGINMITIPDNNDSIIIMAGSEAGHIVLDATVVNGFSSSNNYSKKLLVSVGDTSDIESRIIAVNMDAVSKTISKGYASTSINFTASLLGTDIDIETDSIDDIQWSVEGGVEDNWFVRGTSITSSDDNTSAILYISRNEPVGKTLTVTVTCGDISNTCEVHIVNKYTADEPYVPSLRNFGRNFINLKSINHIPSTVNGDDCLRNFLMGCTSFNQSLIIPNSVAGNRCLKYFLRGCTSFNSDITLPEELYGDNCLHGFLYGCTTFNKPISIPDGVTGNGCLERFLMLCTSFNQEIVIPDGVKGSACLRNFMTECREFNHSIKIPEELEGEHCMDLFMRDCTNMTSTVTINRYAAAMAEVNGQTLSSVFSESDMITKGVPIVGTGARIFTRKAYNYLVAPPYRNISTTEPEDEEHTITINQAEGIAVTSDLDAAFPGDTVTLTIESETDVSDNITFTPNHSNIKIEKTAKLNVYEFIMWDDDVVIDVIYNIE